MQFKVGAATDVGKKRTQNQDHLLVLPEYGIFAVADGMGGHRGGEVASHTALQCLREFFEQNRALMSKTPPQELLLRAIASTNRILFEKSKKDPQIQGMGTTLTCLFFTERQLFIGQVGDSRCYLIKPEAIWQLTRDHSLVQEKVRAGLITREQMKTDSMRNVITRCVGYESQVEIDLFSFQPQPDHLFMICSDGLSGQLDDQSLLKIAQDQFFTQGDPEKAVRQYIEAANLHGGDDNITCIVVQKV